MRLPRVFGGAKVDLVVTTDRDAYLPGDTVEASIRITGVDELEVEEGRVELVYENEYTYRELTTRGGGRTQTRSTTETDRTVYAAERLFGARTVQPGETIEQTVALPIPQTAVPSGEGEITKVRWKVNLVLSRPRFFDPDTQALVRVLSLPDAYASWAQTPPEIDDQEACEREFRLAEGRAAAAGSTIRGELAVTPREELEPQEIRVELVRKEEVPQELGNEHEEIEATAVVAQNPALTARIPQEFSFELAVPAGVCPTLETNQSTVHWYLRGVLARRLRDDYNIVEELNVHTGTR